MTFFGFLFGIDALIAAILLFFFMQGMGDGTVSAFNIVLWLGILTGMAAVLGGGMLLHSKEQRIWANLLLSVPAWPGLLFGLWCLLLIVMQPRWN